ncbi:uncharacterized protein LOC117342699 [Pecten maximus]|uniref:uncharacterized protein LOC117342699 n=1 Tax=Pecten maximus TaxID=6579 RepID=UPI001458588F|nr:uncharacterized protein LOC117342699 [Pecten maximus]
MADSKYLRHTYHPNTENTPVGHVESSPLGRSLGVGAFQGFDSSDTNAELKTNNEVAMMLRRSVVYTGNRNTFTADLSNQNTGKPNLPLLREDVLPANRNLYRQDRLRATMPAGKLTGESNPPFRPGLSRNEITDKLSDSDDVTTHRSSDNESHHQRDVDSNYRTTGTVPFHTKENKRATRKGKRGRKKQRREDENGYDDEASVFSRKIPTRWSTRGVEFDAMSGKQHLSYSNWWHGSSDDFTDTQSSSGSTSLAGDENKHPWWKNKKMIAAGLFIALVAMAMVSVIFVSLRDTPLIEKTQDVSVEMGMTLVEPYKAEYNDSNSPEFQNFQNDFCEQVRQTYTAADSVFKEQYSGCIITGLT